MRRAFLACFVMTLVAAPSPARAELAFFASGRSLSVRSHRLEAGALVLELRGGGEVVCDPSMITKIAPDEVPYPEDAPAAPAPPAAAPAVPYGDIIDAVAAEQQVDVRLVRAVIRTESAYRRTARSQKGAMGLMQIMPGTARQYEVADPYDPRANIEAGVKHLKTLLARYPLTLALAAYNAGEAAVQRFGGVPPYAETRDYVSAILSRVGGGSR